MALDLASFDSIQEFAKNFLAKDLQLHILVCNAAAMSDKFEQTQNGFELMFGVGQLGHFLLASLLIDKIVASVPSRIVVLTSTASMVASTNYDKIPAKKASEWGKMQAYSDTKLANGIWAVEMARRLQGTGVVVSAVHPGVIGTDLSNRMMGSVFLTLVAAIRKTVPQGAATTCFAAAHPSLENGPSGKYYEDCHVAKGVSAYYSQKHGRKLWSLCERLTNTTFLPQNEAVTDAATTTETASVRATM